MSLKKNTKLNYFWNLIFQIYTLICPLIVTPYASRVLGTDGIGKYSFAFSIVYYFTLIALLGFNYYAQREIAKYQGDKYKQSKIFHEIFILRGVSTIVALTGYFILIISGALREYNTLLFILGLNIVAILIDPTFLLQGNEEFKQISIRNLIAKTIIVVLMFVLVRKSSDLWIYTLLNASLPVVSALAVYPYLKNHICKVKFKELHPFNHLVPTLKLFIPTVAMSIYVVLDKTMIGLIIPGEVRVIQDGVEVVKKISDIENGYYEQADKIVKFSMTIVTSLSTVMIPRNSQYFASKQDDKVIENIYKACKFTLFLAVPMTFGLLAIASNFTPWFFGEGYEKVPYIIMILSPVTIFIGMSGVFGLQYLVPKGKDGLFTISVCTGAVVNFGLNILLIYLFQSYGAAIASIIAEFSVLLVQLIILRKEFSVKKIISDSWKYFISGGTMFLIVLPVAYISDPSIKNTVLIALLGILVYICMLFVLKDEALLLVIKKVKGKLRLK